MFSILFQQSVHISYTLDILLNNCGKIVCEEKFIEHRLYEFIQCTYKVKNIFIFSVSFNINLADLLLSQEFTKIINHQCKSHLCKIIKCKKCNFD